MFVFVCVCVCVCVRACMRACVCVFVCVCFFAVTLLIDSTKKPSPQSEQFQKIQKSYFYDLSTLQFPAFVSDCVILSLCSAVGQIFIYHTISTFGPVVFTIIMTIRQVIIVGEIEIIFRLF